MSLALQCLNFLNLGKWYFHVVSEKDILLPLTFLSLRMKRISISQRNVAAAPVHTKMITSMFGFPSSPGKRKTFINHQTTLAKILFSFHDLINCHITLTAYCEELQSKGNWNESVTNLQKERQFFFGGNNETLKK